MKVQVSVDEGKRHACIFCGKLYIKIARHLCDIHQEECEIASLPYIPKSKSCPSGQEAMKKRSLGIAKLRNLGDFNYNLDVLLNHKGTLLLGRRAVEGYVHGVQDYVPCKYCLVMFYQRELWRHAKSCAFRTTPLEQDEKKRAKHLVEAGRLLLRGGGVKPAQGDLDPDFLQLVLGRMQNDDISLAVKSDPLILLLGKSLFDKLGKMRAGDVRSRLRNLSRLKLCIRKVAKMPEANISDCLSPKLYDKCIDATKSLCGISKELNLNGAIMLDKPSLAKKLGHLLTKVATLKRGQAIRQRDVQAKQDADEFLQLHEAEWCDKISSLAQQTLSQRKFNKQEILPMTEDLVKLKVRIAVV